MSFFPLFGGGALAAAIDPDAAVFFTAAGITNATQKSAVDTMVVSLKAASLWTKLLVVYPFVGGTATPHSFNLKNPATFQITWAGTITHNANGITGDGSTGYGNTGFDFASVGGMQDNASILVYCRTQTPADFGMFMGGHNGGISIAGIYRSGAALFGFINSNLLAGLTTGTDFRGFLAGARNISTAEVYAVRATTTSQATVSTSACSRQLSLLSRSYAGFPNDNFTNANLAFAAAGYGFTEAELGQIQTIVQTFQTTLGRQV